MFDSLDEKQGPLSIAKQLTNIQKKLTEDSAIELCNKRFFHNFLIQSYQTDEPDYECVYHAYINLLRAILRLVPRSTFFDLLKRNCPECLVMELLYILFLHPVLENDVYLLFHELLFDVNGDIVTQGDILQMTSMLQNVYGSSIKCCPRCLGYKSRELPNEVMDKAQAIGKLISSDKFCALMKTSPMIGTWVAQELFHSMGHDSDKTDPLCALLLKYDA